MTSLEKSNFLNNHALKVQCVLWGYRNCRSKDGKGRLLSSVFRILDQNGLQILETVIELDLGILDTGITYTGKCFEFCSQFLHERIEVAKYCSQDQIEMYTEMLQRTLDIQVCFHYILLIQKFKL
jgi:hypothetical protein